MVAYLWSILTLHWRLLAWRVRLNYIYIDKDRYISIFILHQSSLCFGIFIDDLNKLRKITNCLLLNGNLNYFILTQFNVPCFLMTFMGLRLEMPVTKMLVLYVALKGSNVMEDQDLREIGIADPSHRKKILHAARSFPKVINHWFLL